MSLSVILAVFLPQTAIAYIGPGSGLSAIGSFLALFVGVAIAIIGFIWYPLKRLLGKKKPQEPEQCKNKDE